MNYHKVCALPGCRVEFNTTMERKIYCCHAHYKIGNKIKTLKNQKENRRAARGKFPCLLCEKKKNAEPHTYCQSCKTNINTYEISDNCLGYLVRM